MGLRQTYSDNHLKVHELLDVPYDEPIFIIRAKDKFSISALFSYRDIVHNGTLIGEKSEEWTTNLESIIGDFINWQRDNKTEMKVPD